jgi:Ase1/PRC1/MAP65 family protein
VVSNLNVGTVDLSDLMVRMDGRIAKAREQAISRKDILEKVEKWKFAVEEESWLDEYERVYFLLYRQLSVTLSSLFC